MELVETNEVECHKTSLLIQDGCGTFTGHTEQQQSTTIKRRHAWLLGSSGARGTRQRDQPKAENWTTGNALLTQRYLRVHASAERAICAIQLTVRLQIIDMLRLKSDLDGQRQNLLPSIVRIAKGVSRG